MRIIAFWVFVMAVGQVLGASLRIDVGGFGEYDCETEAGRSIFDTNYVPLFVTGAAGEIVLTVGGGETEYRGVYRTWPDGLELEIGHWNSINGNCRYDPMLMDLLDLSITYTAGQTIADSIWRATGREPMGYRSYPQVRLKFTVPESFAESFLCINARWSHSDWEDLEAIPGGFGPNEPGPLVIEISAPCSDLDIQRAKESHVFEAWLSGNHEETLDLAEDLIDQGANSASVFLYAFMSSKNLGQYDKALRFWDECYDTYGDVGAGSSSEANTREYERMRSQILELKANQEEQQR